MDGGLVAAALGDGSEAGVLLGRGGVWEALAALAEGDEEATRCKGGAGAGGVRKGGVVRQRGGAFADLVVEALEGSAKPREQGFDEQPAGLDQRLCSGQLFRMAVMRRSMSFC